MLVNYGQLSDIRNKHKDESIVLVKGTFDLFHIGHLNLLRRAKSLGDILVVIVKCDEAVKFKGTKRPFVDEYNRALIVDSIKYTDYCVIANEKNSRNYHSSLNEKDKLQFERYSRIIKELKPNIVIKQPDNCIPQCLLELYDKYSTKVIELERTEGISTTEIINKIRR